MITVLPGYFFKAETKLTLLPICNGKNSPLISIIFECFGVPCYVCNILVVINSRICFNNRTDKEVKRRSN